MARRAAGSCLRPDVALRARRRRRGHLPAGLAARHLGTAPLSVYLLPAYVPSYLCAWQLDDTRRRTVVDATRTNHAIIVGSGPPPLSPRRPASRLPALPHV